MAYGEQTGDPSDDKPETHAERFFAALRLWGLVEALLDMCLLAILSRHETRQPLPSYPPTLERKLDYLSEAFRLLPSLSEGGEIASKVDSLFRAEKGLRNDIVHGSPLDYEDDGSVHFMLLQRRKGALPHYVLRTVTPKDWDRLSEVSIILFVELVALLLFVHPISDDVAGLSEDSFRRWEIKSAGEIPGSRRLRELMQTLAARHT